MPMPTEPDDVQQSVDQFIDRCNRSALDYPDDIRFAEIPDVHVDGLHELAAKIYAMGWSDGALNVQNRVSRQRNRRRDREIAEQTEVTEAHRSLAEQGRTV